MADKKVEMPSGDVETFDAETIEELKEAVSRIIGVDEDEVAIVDEEGQSLSEGDIVPERARIIPKQEWGAIDMSLLMQDMLDARDASGYDNQYRIRLTEKGVFNPFRVYLIDVDEEWPVLVELHSYPLEDHPDVTFEDEIPPCPEHEDSWHPNVFDDGSICWGDSPVLPGTRIIGLLNTLHSLLQNPNHDAAVADRCEDEDDEDDE